MSRRAMWRDAGIVVQDLKREGRSPGYIRTLLGLTFQEINKLMLDNGGELVSYEKEEAEATEKALPAVGAYVASVGMDKPLADYTREEALGLVRAAVQAFQIEMHQIQAEALKDTPPWQ